MSWKKERTKMSHLGTSFDTYYRWETSIGLSPKTTGGIRRARPPGLEQVRKFCWGGGLGCVQTRGNFKAGSLSIKLRGLCPCQGKREKGASFHDFLTLKRRVGGASPSPFRNLGGAQKNLPRHRWRWEILTPYRGGKEPSGSRQLGKGYHNGFIWKTQHKNLLKENIREEK